MRTDPETDEMAAVAIPPGVVVAYAGEVNDTGGVVMVQPGWLLCNGAAVSDQQFPALFRAIQASHGNGQDAPLPLPGASFNLPDYRGTFLRGVSGTTGRDPDSGDADRPQNHPGGNVGNRVGSIQRYATALPNRGFQTDQHGGHSHRLDLEMTASRVYKDGPMAYNTVANPFTGAVTKRTDGDGAHAHAVEGGDRETRPLNAYVHWIIKT
jgi:hypothetical protein